MKKPIPLSMKIIAALFILDASLKLAALQSGVEIVLGFEVNDPAAISYKVLFSALLMFVGFGLWNMRASACRVALGVQAYRILDHLAILRFLFANWNPNASKYPPVFSALMLALVGVVPALIQAVILLFLIRRKASFENPVAVE